MYEIGTLVLYDKRGVYRIESLGASPIRGTTGDYYKLNAVFSSSNEIIYTPVNMTSAMRPLISASEALRGLELFSRLDPLCSVRSKQRNWPPTTKVCSPPTRWRTACF